jgi:N-acetylgalactosamine kinase
VGIILSLPPIESNKLLLNIFLESIRVEHFCKIARSIDDEDGDEDDAVEQMSELLSKSHNSLKTLYECSHPNLDELVNISKGFGVGARLTGAGKIKKFFKAF